MTGDGFAGVKITLHGGDAAGSIFTG